MKEGETPHGPTCSIRDALRLVWVCREMVVQDYPGSSRLSQASKLRKRLVFFRKTQIGSIYNGRFFPNGSPVGVSKLLADLFVNWNTMACDSNCF